MIRGVGEGVAKIVGDLEKTLQKLVDPKVHSQWTNSSEPAAPFLIVALPSGLQIYRVAPYFRDNALMNSWCFVLWRFTAI